MRRKAVIDRLYLFFWFFPIVLLPFTWVNAVVQGAEILGLIQGSGFVVCRNFPALTIFLLSDKCRSITAKISDQSL